MRQRRVWIGLVFATSVSGCDTSAVESKSELGVTHQAVGTGIYDVDNQFSEVARITGFGNNCSSVLISNRHLLTASHCFTEQGDRRSNPVNATFAFDPTVAGLRPLQHTPANSGPIPARISNFDPWRPSHEGGDLAIVKLDQAVPPSIASPTRIAGFLGEARCSDELAATQVGYGPTDSFPLFYGPAGPRNWAFNDGWTPNDVGNDQSRWLVSWVFTENWRYNLPGDSGGPLFSLGTKRICGIASTFFPRISPLIVLGIPVGIQAVAAAANVQSQSNLAWLASVLLDSSGRFIDACVPGELPDADGDGVGDRCDNCKFTAG